MYRSMKDKKQLVFCLWSIALVFQTHLCFVIGGSGSSNILPEARISFLGGLFPAISTPDVPFVADLTSK